MPDDIDEILSEIEKPDDGIPMGDEGAGGAPDPAAAAAPSEPPSWDPKPWEFDHNGKKVFPDSADKARTWMSQGYNYSQRMAEMNRRQKEIDELSGKYKGFDRYSEVDQFAKQNPDWWKFVEEQYSARGQQQPQNGQALPDAALKPFLERLEKQESFINQLQQERQKQDEQRHDQALSAEVESIREAHPNIDFDAVDQSGKTLEGRIIDHAVQIGTSSFRAAFRDYLHDQLLESAKAQKLAAEAKEPQVKRDRGILGVSPTPRKQPSAPVNLKGRSWDDAARMAAEELGLTS